MNELIKTTNAIRACPSCDVVPQIMAVCRAVTPQFYKGMTDLDVKAEQRGIELLTSDISQECLSEMCKLAVLDYPRSRSENPKAYFDINYILTFYKQAFNRLYCKSVNLPKDAVYISGTYDDSTHILTEIYETPNGEKISIKEICEVKNSQEKPYSSKAYERLFTDLEDLE